MSGEDATCLVTEDGTVDDTTTYLRAGPLRKSDLDPRSGRKHAIVTLLRSSDTGRPKKEKRSLVAGSLTGSIEESAFNQATVRLIRQKKG